MYLLPFYSHSVVPIVKGHLCNARLVVTPSSSLPTHYSIFTFFYSLITCTLGAILHPLYPVLCCIKGDQLPLKVSVHLSIQDNIWKTTLLSAAAAALYHIWWQQWDFRCDRFPARPKFSSFMTTRSGATYKPMEQQRDSHTEGGAAKGRATTSTALTEISQLTEMVRVMMEERECRERERSQKIENTATDSLRRENAGTRSSPRNGRNSHWSTSEWTSSGKTTADAEESERCLHDVRLQMEHLQSLVAGHSTATTPTRATNTESIKLTKLGEGDDVEAYLTTFERIMEVNEVNRERWPFQLAPQLTGKAQQAYAALTPDDTPSKPPSFDGIT